MSEKETKKDRVVVDKKGKKLFDTHVHHRDPQTGKIVDITPYTLTIENGIRIYTDRATGKKYFQNGAPYNSPKAHLDEAESSEKSKKSEKTDKKSEEDKK